MPTRSSSVSPRPQPALASNEAATSADGSMMFGKKSKAAAGSRKRQGALSKACQAETKRSTTYEPCCSARRTFARPKSCRPAATKARRAVVLVVARGTPARRCLSMRTGSLQAHSSLEVGEGALTSRCSASADDGRAEEAA